MKPLTKLRLFLERQKTRDREDRLVTLSTEVKRKNREKKTKLRK